MSDSHIVDFCKGNNCPIKKQCARYNPGGRGLFFHPQYHNGECILFVPLTATPHHTNQKNQESPCSQ